LFTYVLSMKPPYSYERLLYRLESHPDPQMLVEPDRQQIRRAYRVNGRPILVTLHFTGGLEQPQMHIETAARLSALEQAELLRMIRHMFSADVDLQPIYAHMEEDVHLRPLAVHFRGLRFLLDPDLFQSMTRTIIGQQLNLAFAATLTKRLLHLAGDAVDDENGNTLLVFPTADAVASLDVSQLRELQFSQRKAEYIIDFARAVVDGKVELERLQQMADEEVISYLTPLRGIGRWTAECLLMFGMGRLDLLPAADIGLRNGIQIVYGLAEKPNEAEIRRIGAGWSPWRSYVSLYMWESVSAARRGEPPFQRLPR